MMKLTPCTIIAAGLLACAQNQGPQQEAMQQSRRVVVYDTVRVTETVYDTARIVRYDTVQVQVVRDTVHVERLVTVHDTVWTVVEDSVDSRDLEPESLDHVENYLPDIEEGIISGRALAEINRGVPAFTPVGAGVLDSLQLALIATAFDVLPAEIVKFRWAPSVASPSDHGAGSVTCVIWLRSDNASLQREVLSIAASGKIVDSEPE